MRAAPDTRARLPRGQRVSALWVARRTAPLRGQALFSLRPCADRWEEMRFRAKMRGSQVAVD